VAGERGREEDQGARWEEGERRSVRSSGGDVTGERVDNERGNDSSTMAGGAAEVRERRARGGRNGIRVRRGKGAVRPPVTC
jgi:hypothetical protein